MLTPHPGLHFPERHHIIVAVMEERSAGKGSNRLTELREHAFLLGSRVRPKEMVPVVCLAYDQHPDEIMLMAPRDTFDVEVYGRLRMRKGGRSMDVNLVLPECLC